MYRLSTGNRSSSNLTVVTIGTGTGALRLDRGGPCSLVACGNVVAAVDLGVGSLHGLARAGLRAEQLDAVFLTHLHPDHVAELGSLLFDANYGDSPRERPLVLAGGAGTRAHVEGLQALHGHWLIPKSFVLQILEIEVDAVLSLGPLTVRAGPSFHIRSSLSYRFSTGAKSLVFSGDTGPSRELEGFAKEADVLILECTCRSGEPAKGHLTPEQAGDLARSAGARELVLHHLTTRSDVCSPGAGAAAGFGKAAVVARDGMQMQIGGEALQPV